jgi:hypothetical protein
MKGHTDKTFNHLIKAIEADRDNDWYYKLISAYNMLNIMGMAMKGPPLERRARLLNMAERRKPKVSREDFYDIIGK